MQVDQSWSNSTVLDVVTSVPDYEECQAFCRVRKVPDFDVKCVEISRTRSAVKPGLGLPRTTRCFLIIVGCTLTSETPWTTRTLLGRNQQKYFELKEIPDSD